MIVTAKLWVNEGRFSEFETFETRAFDIMARHGVKVVSVKQNRGAQSGEPHETHVLDFPSMEAFEAYRTDPELLALAEMREACIEKTEIEFS